MNKIRYDFNFLQSFCKENNIELIKDLSKCKVNRNTIIETKCLNENCNDACNKTFRQFFKSGSFCKNCTMKNRQEKSKKTNLEIYGFKHPFQNSKVKEQIKQTNLEKYGCHPSQNYEIKEKTKQTNLEKYGCHSSQTVEVKERMKQTFLKNLGCEHPMKNEKVKETFKQTNLKNFGCENPMQNAEVAEKSLQNSYKSKDYTFPSGRIERIQGYEHFMLNDLLKENISEDDISVKRNEVPTVWYIDENEKKHRYYVDCFIKSQNRCIEAKSKWTEKQGEDVIFLKQKALKDDGYECEIWIYNEKGEKVECHK